MRTFSTEFKEAVVVRLDAGERMAAVSDELKIRRKLLYEWRAAYRELGAAGLNRKRGRKPGGARASPDAAPATPAPLTELARAQARIVELERKIGKQQMDLDFFREALRLIDARDLMSRATPSTRSLKK
jgi:transposase-like protein